MADLLQRLDVAFTFLIRATAQASMVVIVVLAARAAFRRWLSPGARYALWLLLVLPFVAPLLPAVPFAVPDVVRRTVAPEPSPAAPPEAWAAVSSGWRVEYGPL